MPSLPPFIVEIDAADAISTAGLFVLGTSVLGGTDVLATTPRWTAVSNLDVQQIAIRRGRTREDSAVDVGTATITLDGFNGNYDPDNAGGLYYYTYGAVNLLRIGVAVRIKVTVAAVDYVLFTGTLESASSTFGRSPQSTWTCVDKVDTLGHYGVAPLPTFQRSGETSSARATWLLDYARIPAADYTVSAAGRTLTPTKGGGTVLSMLESVVRSEQGRVFADRSGKIIVRWNASEVGRATALTLTDAVSATALDYSDVRVAPGIEQVVNESHVTQRTVASVTDGTGQVTDTEVEIQYGAGDGTSIAKFGSRSVSFDTPLLLAADAQKLADYLSTYRATPATRPADVVSSLVGLADTPLASACQLELGDWVAIARTTPDGRSLTWTVAVEGIDHTISPTAWDLTLHNAPTATAITW